MSTDMLELIRSAMNELSDLHRRSAEGLGISIPDGYPKWNDGDAIKGPRQEFHFRVGERAASIEAVGTQQLVAYAKGDAVERRTLNALMAHLCGHPDTRLG